jgi:signal transduction protein with GAF and PtsI domain
VFDNSKQQISFISCGGNAMLLKNKSENPSQHAGIKTNMSKEKKYCESLSRMVATLNSSLSHAQMVYSIVESVAKTMRAKGCSLMLLTPDKKILLHTSAYGLSDWFVRKGPVTVDKSMTDTLSGTPITVLDIASDERIQYQKQLIQEGIVSVLSVPVTLKEEVIGVMRVYTSAPYVFTDEDIKFATMATNVGAIALETARFYQTLQQDYDSFRQDMLQWRAELGDEWMMEPTVLPPDEQYIELKPPFD